MRYGLDIMVEVLSLSQAGQSGNKSVLQWFPCLHRLSFVYMVHLFLLYAYISQIVCVCCLSLLYFICPIRIYYGMYR